MLRYRRFIQNEVFQKKHNKAFFFFFNISNRCFDGSMWLLFCAITLKYEILRLSGIAKGGQVGARALGRRPWGCTSTLLQAFKNAF